MATSRMSSFLRQLTRGMAALTLADQTDRELVQRVLDACDEAAFEALVRRHGPMVYRVCWRVLQQPEDAEDAFQATFLLLARKLSSVKKSDSLASWLHGVAHRVSLDAKKQAAKRRRHEGRVLVSSSEPPDDLTWKELRTVLDAELASLPEKLRLPLVLHYLEGQSQEEAAKQMGWSKRTLLRRLEEARTALGRRLTRKGFVWAAASMGVLLSDRVAPAALSSRFIGSTVEAAASEFAGRTASGIVSAKVTALTEGVMKTMFVTKMKFVVPAVVMVGALVSGAGVLFTEELTALFALPSLAAEPPAKKPAATSARSGGKPIIERNPLIVHEDAQVLEVAWSADSKIVATVCNKFDLVDLKGGDETVKGLVSNSTAKLWDANTGKLVKSLGEEQKAYIRAIAFSPDKKRAAIAGFGEKEMSPFSFVRVFDAETWAVKHELGDVPGVSALAFSPDGKTLAMGGSHRGAEDGKGSFVALWDVQGEKMKARPKFAPADAGQPQPQPDLPENREPPNEWDLNCLSFSPDGKMLAAGEHNRKAKRARIQMYEGETGKPKQELDLGELDKPRFFRVAFTADGKSLVSACGSVKIWDVSTGKVRRTLDAKGLTTILVTVSPNGSRLAAYGVREEKDKIVGQEILLWDSKTAELKQTITLQESSEFVLGKTMWVPSIAISPDGKSLAIARTTDADVKVEGSENTKGELRIVPMSF